MELFETESKEEKTTTCKTCKHVLPAEPYSEVYLEDCVTGLKRYADNHFDLAIVDPPYGIDDKLQFHDTGTTKNKMYGKKRWDTGIPSREYFDELMRVSKNQIIWGG